MPEYNITFVIDLRLTGDLFVEAGSLKEAHTLAQKMLDNKVFDMDFTIYEDEVQSEDMFWDQDLFEVDVRDIKEISHNGVRGPSMIRTENWDRR